MTTVGILRSHGRACRTRERITLDKLKVKSQPKKMKWLWFCFFFVIRHFSQYTQKRLSEIIFQHLFQSFCSSQYLQKCYKDWSCHWVSSVTRARVHVTSVFELQSVWITTVSAPWLLTLTDSSNTGCRMSQSGEGDGGIWQSSVVYCVIQQYF